MATNLIQSGNVLTFANATGAAVASGQPLIVGDLFTVALTDIPNGSIGALAVTGVYELAAVTTAAINPGQKVYFDATAEKITPTATDNTFAGYAWAAKASSAATCLVRIG